MTVLICGYSSLGGFWSVVVTDIMQFIVVVLATAIFVAVGLLGFAPAVDLPLSTYGTNIPQIILSPGWAGITAILGVTFGWYLVTMDTWQRAAATRNKPTTVGGAWAGTLILLIAITVFVIIGMYDTLAIGPFLESQGVAGHSGGVHPIHDIYLMIPYLSEPAKFAVALFALALVMAGLSTADTFLIVASHSFVSDLLIGLRKRASFGTLTDQDQIFFAQIGRLIVLAMGVFIVAIYFVLKPIGILENPLNFFYVAYSLQFALFAPVVYSMANRSSHATAILVSLVFGFLVSLAWGLTAAIAAARSISLVSFVTPDEIVYLTPIPTMGVGVVSLWLCLRFAKK